MVESDGPIVVMTNLQFQKRTVKKPIIGDIFSLMLPGSTFLFGLVIGADLPSGRAPMPGSYLLYVYADQSPNPEPDLDNLSAERLLIAPFFTNRMLWTKGYAQTIGNMKISAARLLPQHCFKDLLLERYYDEQGRTLPRRYEPCGSWGLGSYRKLDDLISDALGIERVPVLPGD